MEGMENDRIAKRECAGCCSVGRLRKRWNDIVKDCLIKRRFDDRQARRRVHDRSEWRGL